MVSGNPNQLPLDRKSTKVNNSSNDPEHISLKLPHNLHHPKKPMELCGMSNILIIVNGQILESKGNEVNTKRAKAFGNGDSESPHNKDHKVLIIGDSHMRNCAANIKSTIKGNFEVQGVVKPGAEAHILVNAMKNKFKSLSKSDIVVLCGGANDVETNNSSMALHQIMVFVANNKHTNIVLITAPQRYDLMQSSRVNSAVNLFNRKLKKLIKAHHHATLLEKANIRKLFTNHGLHLNGQGKERLANQIVSHIYSILERSEGSPIILNWKKEQ
jgi:hypothetical protein